MLQSSRFWILFWIALSGILALFGHFSESYALFAFGSGIVVSLIGAFVSYQHENRIVLWLLVSMAFQNFGAMKLINYSVVVGFFGSFICIILAGLEISRGK